MSMELPRQPEILPEQAFTEYVFKISSLCNMQPPSFEEDASLLQLPIIAQGGVIGCDQCYEYAGNSAWKEQPATMSLDVVQQAATRIAEHAQRNDIEDIRIIAHGGEPLMLGADYLDQFAKITRETIGVDERRVHLSMQTNGLLMTDKKLAVLLKHDFSIGLSLDGDKVANDLHRRDKLGRSTYDRVVRAARMLDANKANWGIITVVDTASNPEDVLESLAALRPRSIKLHPPHANWSSPPKLRPNALSHGEWQIRAFERYRRWSEFHSDQAAAPFSLHLADDYIDALLGASPTDERVSNRYPHELFFLANGDIQRLDTLKVTEEGAYKTRYNVFDYSLDEVAKTDPGFIARRMGTAALSEACQSCIFLEQCGGDYYPLRFKQTETALTQQSTPEDFAEAFRNPSVYCSDQKQLLGHIATFVAKQKQAINTTPVDIRKIWIGDERARNQDDAYREGTLAYIHSKFRHTIPTLKGAFDGAADLVRDTMVPLVGGEIHAPDIPEVLRDEFQATIRDGVYSGSGALLALEQLSKIERPDDTLYFHAGKTKKASQEHFRLAEQVTRNKTDAIVQALFNPDQLLLRDLRFACVRSDDYWLVTKNAVEALARFADMPSASFVSILQIPPQYSESLEPGLTSLEAEHFIAQQQPFVAPVRVGFRDLPHHLLVVDVPDGTAEDMVKALHAIAELLPQCGDFPSKAVEMLGRQAPRTELLPLRGEWRWPHERKNRSLVGVMPFGDFSGATMLSTKYRS